MFCAGFLPKGLKILIDGGMPQSRTITLHIEQPVEKVYAFCAEPANFPKWAVLASPRFEHQHGLVWLADTVMGERLIEFVPHNRFGVLDHAIYKPGEVPMFMPLRVVANGDGTDLIYTFFKRPGMSDEQLASTMEWIESDLWGLKSLLEAL